MEAASTAGGYMAPSAEAAVATLPHSAISAAADIARTAIDFPARPAERARPRLFPQKRAVLKRLLEATPAIVTFFVVSFLIWGPLLTPMVFVVAILSFHAYWMYRTQMNGAHAIKGFILLRRHKKTDWQALYEKERAQGRPALDWDNIRHIVIIPNYTESAEKLRLCLDSLANSEIPDKIVAVLAMEEREGDAGRERAGVLIGEYTGRLGMIFAAYHPWGLPGEVVGKSSNENWAARRAKETLIDRAGYDIDEVTITSCDADTVFDRKYFTCLSYKFATDENRYRRFWQGPIFYYNNIWDVPAPIRMAHCLSGLNHIAKLSRGFLRMVFPQSTYSLSLRMAHDAGYWDPDIIPEDWHMFLKCYYSFQGEVEVETMYDAIYMDGVRSKSYPGTFRNYYQQSLRHAWGCTDLAYAVQQSLDHPRVSRVQSFRRIWAVAETHLLWSTQWFLITTSKVIPLFMVSQFGADLPDWFVHASRWIMLPCGAALILMLTLDFWMRPKRPSVFRIWLFPIQYGVYFFMAFITFFSSALPALDAQFRLALGRRLEYKVTEKA